MTRMPTDKFQILAPPSAFASLGVFIANAMADAFKGGWFFNQFPGEQQADAGVRCSYDWTPLAKNQSADRNWGGAGGPPVFTTDYATFRNDQPLITRYNDFPAAGGCCWILARSTDTTIGATANDRAGLWGSQWSNSTRGVYQEFQGWTGASVRTVGYGVTGSAVALCTGASASNDLDKWKLYFGRASPTAIKTNILSGVGGAPNPAEVPFAGGFYPGTSAAFWMVGGKAPGSSFNPAITKRIAFCLRFTRPPTTPEYDAINAQCRDIISETGIVELATTP